MEEYEKIYHDFMKNYSSGITTGEMVGELVARLAGYYPHYNAAMVKAERGFALTSRDEVLKTDEATGKPISSTKADTIANASPEATAFKNARVHVQNLEMLIQSAKSLQRGLLQEMLHNNLQ
jgi:hypothetical protein